MKSGWETFKGKQIFMARYDHMTIEEVRAEVNEIKKYMSQNQPTSSLLVLVDTTATLVSPEVLNLFKEVAASSGSIGAKTAILGMSGPRRIFLDIVSKFSKTKVVPFDTLQQAQEWLVA